MTEKKINKPISTQIYYAKKSKQKITVRRIENKSFKQPNCRNQLDL